MEESQKINAEIGLEEKNTILQAWADFKDAIFNVLFVILDKKSEEEEEESLFGLALESGLDYLQIMAFPFSSLVIAAWNGGSSLDVMVNFFSQFTLSTYLPRAPFGIFLAVLYGLIFIILLIIIDIVYVSYSFSKKKFRFTFPLVVLAKVVPLFVTVLFLPITQTLLNVVQCQTNTNGQYAMTNYPDMICWTGWHLFHATITLLFATIFVIISTVVALALFEPRMTTNKLTARQNSNGEVVFIINKIVLQFVFTFSPFSGTSFYVVVMFLLSFWQFWCYAIKKPLYAKNASKFFKICSTYYFWTTLMLLMGQVLGTYGFDGALVIWMSGLPFFAIIIYFQNASDVSILFLNNLKFKSGEQLESHISYVLQLVGSQATDKNSYMLLIGYIEKHKEVCTETDCPLKSEHKRKKGQDSMDFSCQQVLKKVDRMFKSGIKKFPNCTKLRMSYAFFFLEQLNNKERAYEEFTNSSKIDPSFQQQFNIYRFKKIIKENLEDDGENQADLIETIRFQNSVSLLEEAMLLSAKLHKEFWTQLKEEIPDLKKLNIIGAQITEAGNAISQNYTELSKSGTVSCEVLFSYGHYQILVSEDYAEGKEMLSNARKIYLDKQSGHRKRTEEMHVEEEGLNKLTSPVLIVTAGATPRIKNTNLMFVEITGYQREELIDRQISKIAPKLFTQQGANCFQLTLQGEQQRSGFLNHKFGHLLTVQYTVIHRPAQQQWQIFLKLATFSSMKMVCLANNSGIITDLNFIAHTLLKQAHKQAEQQGKELALSDIGLQNFANPQYRKQNGFPTEVFFGAAKGECMVQIEPLMVNIYGQNDDNDDEESHMIVTSSKTIGYKVMLSKVERGHLEDQSDINGSEQLVGENEMDKGVLSLYGDQGGIQGFIANLNESSQIQEVQKRFQLKEKIKTMRLLNNEIKMVYTNGAENCADSAQAGQDDDQRELFKFDDQNFQTKLRSAINTNLSHVEVVNLRRASFCFLLLLFTFNILQLYYETTQISTTNSHLAQITKRSNQYSLLSANIMATIDSTANYTALINATGEHEVDFDTDIQIAIQLQNNLTVLRNLKDAVILLNSRLLSYFETPSSPSSIQSVFVNYIASIYPAFLNYPGSVISNLATEYILTGAVILLSILMMSYWVYISLLIDKKRYDIMIWFLDIPVPYVAHLGNHCDKFLKDFVTVKELTQKGIPQEEDQDNIEEFSTKKNVNDDEEIEEQIKARKSLISKNKKATLISKVNITSLKVIWLLIYSAAYSILVLVLTNSYINDYNFLLPQWNQTSQAVIVQNTLYLTLQMRENNITAGTTDLDALANVLQLEHKGVITDNNLETFNYNILSFHLTDIASIYDTVYFSNLCSVLPLSPTNLTQCQTLVGNKLKSGYQVYSKYLISPERSMTNQIWLANQLYVIPALLQMLKIWESSLSNQGNSYVSLCTILLYVFIIISLIFFLLLWLYYLRKLNTELNQTIQMLNMIPFKLLPKSRKETKLFIAWIIRESNKTKHESQ